MLKRTMNNLFDRLVSDIAFVMSLTIIAGLTVLGTWSHFGPKTAGVVLIVLLACIVIAWSTTPSYRTRRTLYTPKHRMNDAL